MKRRERYNLRFKKGDLMVVSPRPVFVKETWPAGPRMLGMPTTPMHKIVPGTAYLALSDAVKSSYKTNRKLYVQVMVDNRLVYVWANHFKMKKVIDE